MTRWGMLALLLCASAEAQEIKRPAAVDDRLVVELVASEPEIATPTGIAVDARGRLWAIENNTHFRPKNYPRHPSDRILIFEDFGPDGRARKMTTFADGFQDAMNLAFAPDGRLFFATRGKVYVLPDADRNDAADEKKVLVSLETAGTYPHNGLSGFAFDAEGWVYFGMGENLGAPYKLVGSDGSSRSGGGEGGNIFRCRPDGSRVQLVATGFWNPFHVAFDAFGRLFTVDNDPDSRPPNRLLHVIQGGDYGYRFRNGRRGLHPFTSWNGELPGTLPMVSGTGEGASGLAVYEHHHLPADYRGTILVTSWGDHVIQRFRLVPRGASFASQPETILKGDENFRPVGIALAPDGSVFLSDWVDKSYPVHNKGRLWRIRAKEPGRPRPEDPLCARFKDVRKDLEAALRDPAEEVRAGAARLMAGNDPRRVQIAATDPSKAVRLEALVGAAGVGALADLMPHLIDPDPFIQSAAIEQLSRLTDPEWQLANRSPLMKDPRTRLGLLLALRRKGGAPPPEVMKRLLEDPEPSVRRAAIQWVGEAELRDYAGAILVAATRAPVTREVFEAYIAASDFLDARSRAQIDQRGSDVQLAKVLQDAGQHSALRTLALRMIRKDHPSVTRALLEKLAASPDADLRLEAVKILALSADEPAQEVLRKLARDRQAAVRAEAAMGLARSAETSAATREVLAELGTPEALLSLGAASSRPEVREAIERLGKRPELEERAALLLGVAQPVPDDEWRRLGAEPGDAAAGERAFFHPRGAQCFVCHRVNGRGGDVGPDLSMIGAALDRAKLVESILDPSRDIAPLFVSWQIATKGGEEFEGRILSEDPPGTLSFVDPQGKNRLVPAAVTLIDARGQTRRIPLEEIRERRALKSSLMPEKLTAVVTRREFRDLIEFLASLK